jgi:hypothetical protein
MSRSRRRCSWMILAALSGGCLLQTTTATSCSEMAASLSATLTTSIVNQLIRNSVYEALGLQDTPTF